MKKAVIQLISIALVLILALGTVFAYAYADGGTWVCPACSQDGNTGNFCSNCGAARPAADWTCPACSQAGNTGNFCSNCGASKPAAGQQTTVSEWLQQIRGVSDRVKVCLKGVQVSDYIVNHKNPGKWVPEHAVDDDQSTCWQVKFTDKDTGKGTVWIQLNTGNEQTVDEIWLKNGFWGYNDKKVDQYHLNARAKTITLSFLYSGEAEFRDHMSLALKDEVFTDWQRFSLGHHEQVAAVRLTVMSKYPGSDYPNDLCLSEAMLVKQAPAAGAKPAPEDKPETVYESNPAVTGTGLLSKLATRSGPGTEYDETGSFFGSNWREQTVKVLGKSWDTRNGIWWVLIDFKNGTKARYRVWTGLRRVDVKIEKLKEINPKGQGTVNSTSKTYRGPGEKYAKAKVTISGWKDVLAFGRENGYVEVEFEQGGKTYRLWVPEKYTSIDWN